MDPVNPQYIKNVVFVTANYFGENTYIFLTNLLRIQDNLDILMDYKNHYQNMLGRRQHVKVIGLSLIRV